MAYIKRTPEQIIQSMLAFKSANPILDTITNTSDAGTLYNLFAAFAYEVGVIEALFIELETQVDERYKDIPIATIRWYVRQTLNFQFGDILTVDLNGQVGYNIIDESKRIVKVASASELSGTILIKCAKKDDDNKTIKLTTPEKNAITQYWIEKRPAGKNIAIVSENADALILSATLWVDGTKITNTGESQLSTGVYPVEDAINNYVDNLDFGGVFYISNLILAIKAVDGVENVVINGCSSLSYNDITSNILILPTQSTVAAAGYMNLSDDSTLLYMNL